MGKASDLGQALRSRRLKERLTQAELAAGLGVSRGWIAGQETGKREGEGKPDALFVARTANYLGIDRRRAFQMAGYTAGEVLELFGTGDGSTPATPVERELADLRQRVDQTNEAVRSLAQALPAGIEAGLQQLLEYQRAEGYLQGASGQQRRPSRRPRARKPRDPTMTGRGNGEA
jgi:transcriptional regulator with XRE-family HTH domain